MSSSAPMETRQLSEKLAAADVTLIDAPVSGGVARARSASLTIMCGGADAEFARVQPILEAMRSNIHRTGSLGTGHAAKALNNFLSAAGLVAACQALIAGQALGLDLETLTDILNLSTGRNNSTESKIKPFILSETFASGFNLSMMAKDLRTAAELAEGLDLGDLGLRASATLWTDAEASLGKAADHTEIFGHLAGIRSNRL